MVSYAPRPIFIGASIGPKIMKALRVSGIFCGISVSCGGLFNCGGCFVQLWCGGLSEETKQAMGEGDGVYIANSKVDVDGAGCC